MSKSKIMGVLVDREKIRVIKAIHGEDGKVRKVDHSGSHSCWLNIVHEINELEKQGIKLLDHMKVKLGMKLESTSLDSSFRRKLRGGIEQEQFHALADQIRDVILAPTPDRWVWSLEKSGVFSRIIQWWDISDEEFNAYEEWLSWIVNIRLPSKKKMMLEGIFYSMWWHLWSFRNKFIFDNKIPSKKLGGVVDIGEKQEYEEMVIEGMRQTCVMPNVDISTNDTNEPTLKLYPDPQHSGSSMYPPPQQFTPVYAAPIHHQHHHTPANPQKQSVSPQPFISPPVTLQSQAEFPQLDSGLAVPTFQPFSNPRNQATIQDGRVTTEDLDAYDSDCNDISLAKAVLMANLSSCDPDVLRESQDASIQDTNSIAPNDLLVLSLVEQMTDHAANLDKENQTNKMVNESLTAELERYKERVGIFEQRLNVDLNKREKLIDSQMDDLIWIRNAKLVDFQQEINTLKETLSNHSQEKNTVIRKLKDMIKSLSRKGKNVVDTAVSKPNDTIAPRMFKLNIEPISYRLKNNRDAYEVYLEKTIGNTDTLHGLIECARKQNTSEPLLESTCMFTKHVQELLVYVSKSCPSLTKPTEKLVAVTPMNKDKKLRFAEPITSSSNIPKQTVTLKTKDSNKPLLTSTGVTPTISASESKPLDNTKNNRITRPPSSNQKHKVVQIVLWYLDSRCSKHMTGNRSQLINFISKFLGAVRFRNDHIAKIMGYVEYQIGNVTISQASKTKSWLWHRRLSHLNFDYITALAKHGLVRDASSTSTSQTSPETPSPIISLGVKEVDHDIEVAHMDSNSYVDFPVPDPSFEESSNRVVIPNNVHSINQQPEHINKWPKDHLIDNVISDPSRLVSTRHQLQDEALFCYFDAFLSFVIPDVFQKL
uniref:RNA-directed DNA polymerase, eukaryota, reverse transcriptase zinc-binding domain protein n=1 Tax=Tanacetum cinerariifolium TaxID=118510 RepID=A0A6L2N2L8_TANCI|nr:RNA-directed DNA polymerase, eukaryota, reverse transcriptase zinc-binding domain protein [Tanacetum cinerariifolium]